jgi:hypothetical protein
MRLKKFNESVESSDVKILTESSTIITYEFEQIQFSVDEDNNQVMFNLSDWLKEYGDICVSENFLKFTPDYIKLMKLFHNFIQSLDDYKLYIIDLPKLTAIGALNQYIKIKYISPSSKFSLIKIDQAIDPSTFKRILKDQYQINFRELLTSGKKTLVLNGLDKGFENNSKGFEKLLTDLILSDNKIIGFGIHWLPSGGNWDSFKKKVELGKGRIFNIDGISYSKYTSFFKALHYNISLEFENEIKIKK